MVRLVWLFTIVMECLMTVKLDAVTDSSWNGIVPLTWAFERSEAQVDAESTLLSE